ncbi:MAG: diguanylate cyclase, partial [Magnetococcus sp. YQC-5]
QLEGKGHAPIRADILIGGSTLSSTGSISMYRGVLQMHARKQTIMVVDDTPGDIDALANILTDHYEITVATSGRDAMEIANSHTPDLIFLGLSLADMDGHETCRRLKSHRHFKEIPIILSASPEEGDHEQSGLEAGAVDYMRQPFSPGVVRSRVAMHLRHKRRWEEMQRLLNTDSLTGLANRRRFEELLHREWRRAMRESVELAVILLEIDRFKQFNAHYGHDHGDLCLTRVVQVLGNTFRRPTDGVARLTGGTFAAVLYHTDWTGTLLLAERMRAGVEALRIPHAASNHSEVVTVSVGYASQAPTRGERPHPLLEAANAMLHHARRNGHNQAHGLQLPVDAPQLEEPFSSARLRWPFLEEPFPGKRPVTLCAS